jgi:hypothetical protein
MYRIYIYIIKCVPFYIVHDPLLSKKIFVLEAARNIINLILVANRMYLPRYSKKEYTVLFKAKKGMR